MDYSMTCEPPCNVRFCTPLHKLLRRNVCKQFLSQPVIQSPPPNPPPPPDSVTHLIQLCNITVFNHALASHSAARRSTRNCNRFAVLLTFFSFGITAKLEIRFTLEHARLQFRLRYFRSQSSGSVTATNYVCTWRVTKAYISLSSFDPCYYAI